MRALIKGEWHYMERSNKKQGMRWRIRAIKNKITYTKYFKTKPEAFKFFRQLALG